MAAGKYNFLIEQGTTVNFGITYKDSTGSPVDLTNYAARMQIRPSVDSSTVICSLSSSLSPDGTGLNISSPISGSINLYISAASSSAFTFTEAVYDLEIISGSIVTRLIEGYVKLSKEVTR